MSSMEDFWLDACVAAWRNETHPVERYLAAGGNAMRRMRDSEVATLNAKYDVEFFSPGLDLVNIALQQDSQDVLLLLLPKDAIQPQPTVTGKEDVRQLWLEACLACMNSDLMPIQKYVRGGGSVSRRLLASEAKELNRNFPNCFNEGETLANLALKWDNEAVLSLVLANVSEGSDKKDSDVNSRAQEEVGEQSLFGSQKTQNDHKGEGRDLRQTQEECEQAGIPYIAADYNYRDNRSDAVGNHQLRRLWLQACLAAYDNTTNPITAYLEAGGERSRSLTNQDIEYLQMSGCLRVGETLVDIALRRDSSQALACVLGETFVPQKKICSRDSNYSDQLRSQPRADLDSLWLDACTGAVLGEKDKIIAYVKNGGELGRRLKAEEATLVNEEGNIVACSGSVRARETLVDIALKYQRSDIIKLLCSDVVPDCARKRLPCHQFVMEASAISKEINANLELSVGSGLTKDMPFFQLNFAIPRELQTLPHDVRTRALNEIIDCEARETLEDENEPVINWCPALLPQHKLHPLYNGGMGDCLLHSASLVLAGIEDRNMAWRASLVRVMKTFDLYSRWREFRAREAALLGYHAEDWQWKKEWSELVRIAGSPKMSLEQTHVWALAHLLRRPIIVYGIQNIRNHRNEILGHAGHQGIYIPFLLDKSECCTDPLALAYVRGHYLGLVGEEKDPLTPTTILLPITMHNGQRLPVQYLYDVERGSEASIIREWLRCRAVNGVACVEQSYNPRASRPEACQALMRRYVEDVHQRMTNPRDEEEGVGADTIVEATL
uniref:ubiquitinyl hydrolase 1 n=1 Tax=Guillardia theta TaxID=55529 RepID=A0A7S4UJ50_GUITH|mmetsp:Transcript_52505/g.162959  ORF Transcript_52505/g.162959 Transcript_52505/m.162959 type:complete len:781 (+) Transcript_52505:154-2496(+)